jgi:hypothetical protein
MARRCGGNFAGVSCGAEVGRLRSIAVTKKADPSLTVGMTMQEFEERPGFSPASTI